MKKNPQIDKYLGKLKRWQKEMEKLRKILLGCPLTEELKWGKPCYTFEKGNVAILYALKESCAIGFLKGALLKDPQSILIKPGENSQSGRWIKFSNIQEIARLESTLKAYIHEAIDAEKAGLKVDFKESKNLVFPVELKNAFEKKPALKTAFEALTPGRQRGYNLYFSGAKQSATRESRIEKCVPQILKGKGLQD